MKLEFSSFSSSSQTRTRIRIRIKIRDLCPKFDSVICVFIRLGQLVRVKLLLLVWPILFEARQVYSPLVFSFTVSMVSLQMLARLFALSCCCCCCS